MVIQTEGNNRPPIDFQAEYRRKLVERKNDYAGDWSRALNDARIAEERMRFYEKAIYELDNFGEVIA